jgi:hypothetical protein
MIGSYGDSYEAVLHTHVGYCASVFSAAHPFDSFIHAIETLVIPPKFDIVTYFVLKNNDKRSYADLRNKLHLKSKTDLRFHLQ